MRRLVLIWLALCSIGLSAQVPARPTGLRFVSGTSSAHPYFDSLVTRPDHYRSYSLRSQAQLELDNQFVTYRYPNDPDPRRQDAAKVVIPPFVNVADYRLATTMDASTTPIALNTNSPPMVTGRAFKLDNEILLVTDKEGSGASAVYHLARGQHGTTPAAHPIGTVAFIGGNSLANTVHLSLQTSDGHTYLLTWDAWFGAEWKMAASGLTNLKTFQLRARKSPGGSPGIWFEVRTAFDGTSGLVQQTLGPADLALVDVRTYSTPIGPNVTSSAPVLPRLATPVIPVERWIRYWVLIDQRAGDWDLMSLWVATATTGPTQILDQRQLENYGLVDTFELEFNTSTSTLKPGRGDLVAYVRNLVILRDVVEPVSVMTQQGL